MSKKTFNRSGQGFNTIFFILTFKETGSRLLAHAL